MYRKTAFIALIVLVLAGGASAQPANQGIRTLIVMFDGLRPDYVTPETMPTLYSLKQRGSYVSANHSVYPTVTRVNASSYATGSYPETHGILGNTVYFPEVDRVKGLNTGEASDLMRIAKATNDKLLTAVSLGEVLQSIGKSMMVFSSGSSGQAMLQNHKVSGGGVVHPQLILPASLEEEVHRAVGPPPPGGKPNKGQHEWVARAFLHFASSDNAPLISAIWFSDPDGAAHTYGIGSPEAMESIRIVDEQFGVVLKGLEERGLLEKYNVIVSADHGFATQKGKMSISKFLMEKGFKQSADSDDVVVAGNAIYVKNSDAAVIRKIVAALQEQPWVGAIFTKPSGKGYAGQVEGTLSFDAVHWNHERSGDILVDYNWDDEVNQFGYKGGSFATGVAGHGGASPHEITIPLIASGPSFKTSFESPLPSSNIDMVPTILHLYGIDRPTSMQGRVLLELLAGTDKLPRAKKETLKTSTKIAGGSYSLVVQRTKVGTQEYVDYAKAVRVTK